MKYIVCERPWSFAMREKEVPSYNSHEVLLQVRSIGICGSDLHAYQGNQAFFEYPRIFGHELGLSVLEVGSHVTHVKPGDKVALIPHLYCGRCVACRCGKTNCCTSLKVLGVHTDGGMQEVIAVPGHLLIEVNDLSYEEIALIEPLAIGAHAIQRAEVNPGEFAVVMGCGPIGLGIMIQAKLRGAKVIAMDMVDSRLKLAQRSFGADFIVRADDLAIEEVMQITNGELATLVFDATGNKLAIERGPDFMAHGGRYVIVGLFNGDLTFHQPKIQAKETSLLISRNAVKDDFLKVISILRSGNFPEDEFITHRITFDNMISQFDQWLDPESGVIKAMVSL